MPDPKYVSKLTIEGVSYEIKDKVAREAIAAGLDIRVVQELPTASEDTMGAIYLVPDPGGAAQDIYDEYVTVKLGDAPSYTYSWEQIGTTRTDLSDYSLKTHTHNLSMGSAMGTGSITYDKFNTATLSFTGTPANLHIQGTPTGNVVNASFTGTSSSISVDGTAITSVSSKMSTASSASGTYSTVSNIPFVSSANTSKVVSGVTSYDDGIYGVPSSIGSETVWKGAQLTTTSQSVATGSSTGIAGSGGTWSYTSASEELAFTNVTFNTVTTAVSTSSVALATGVSATATANVSNSFTPTYKKFITTVTTSDATVVSSITTNYFKSDVDYTESTVSYDGEFTPSGSVSADFQGNQLDLGGTYTPVGNVSITSAAFSTATASSPSSVPVATGSSTGTASS